MKYPYPVFRALKIACELEQLNQRSIYINDTAYSFSNSSEMQKHLEEQRKKILGTLDGNKITSSNGISWADGENGWQDKLKRKER